jgi:hypothetical protein
LNYSLCKKTLTSKIKILALNKKLALVETLLRTTFLPSSDTPVAKQSINEGDSFNKAKLQTFVQLQFSV